MEPETQMAGLAAVVERLSQPVPLSLLLLGALQDRQAPPSLLHSAQLLALAVAGVFPE